MTKDGVMTEVPFDLAHRMMILRENTTFVYTWLAEVADQSRSQEDDMTAAEQGNLEAMMRILAGLMDMEVRINGVAQAIRAIEVEIKASGKKAL